ncbi:hypothetical protein D3C84_1139200 [compost metagenome]
MPQPDEARSIESYCLPKQIYIYHFKANAPEDFSQPEQRNDHILKLKFQRIIVNCGYLSSAGKVYAKRHKHKHTTE